MINKKEVMELAMSYIKRDTYDPYTAVIMALETWLKKKNMQIVPTLPEGQVK